MKPADGAVRARLGWYAAGVGLILAAWAAGFAVYEAIAVLKLTVGGSIPSMLAAGLLYWVLSRKVER